MLLWNAHQRYAYLPLQGSVPAITAVCVGDTLFKGMQNEGYQAVKGCRPSSFTFVFQVCGRNHGNGGDAASLPHFCRFALRNVTIKIVLYSQFPQILLSFSSVYWQTWASSSPGLEMSAEPQEFQHNVLSHGGVCVLAARTSWTAQRVLPSLVAQRWWRMARVWTGFSF